MKENLNRWKKSLPLMGIVLVIAAIVVGLFYLSGHYGPPLGQSEKESLPEKMVQVGDNEEIVGGVHVATGLVAGEGLNQVIANCTGCHSPKLITQNRASREGWIELIRWMQKTQNLWDLGDHEEAIVNYLSEYYAPVEKGRRAPLMDIEWYELK